MLFYGVWIWLLARDPKCWRFLDTRIVEDFHGSVFFFGLPPPENLKVVGTGAIAEDIGCGTDVFVHIKDCALILTKAYQRQYHRIWKGISHISDVSDTLQKSNMANIRQTLQKTWQWKITKCLIRRYGYIHYFIVVFPFPCFFFLGFHQTDQNYQDISAFAIRGTDGKQPLTGDVLSFVMEPSASKPGQMATWAAFFVAGKGRRF